MYDSFVLVDIHLSFNQQFIQPGGIKHKNIYLKVAYSMKFDIVIGNPPYNHGIDMDFIAVGYRLSAVCCCMIAPAKWQTSDDRQSIASRTT